MTPAPRPLSPALAALIRALAIRAAQDDYARSTAPRPEEAKAA